MKRLFVIFLMFCVILCGCNSSSSKSKDFDFVFSNPLDIGNFRFDIPDSFEYATTESGNAFVFFSHDKTMSFSFIAHDISSENEIGCKGTLIAFEDSIKSKDFSYIENEPMSTNIGGFDVVLSPYIKLDDNLSTGSVIGAAFTDSYYVYRIILDYNSETDIDLITDFVVFLTNSKYLGESPRFDFVQCADFMQ